MEHILRGLKALLIRKIAITGLFWCIPLLVLQPSGFVALGIPAPEPLLFVRLLGAAYLALLIAYYAGMRAPNPEQVIYTGIASNGLACFLLVYFGANGTWSLWGSGAQIFMWLSAAGAGTMTFRLLQFRRALCGNG